MNQIVWDSPKTDTTLQFVIYEPVGLNIKLFEETVSPEI